jgi:hypothetical protein
MGCGDSDFGCGIGLQLVDYDPFPDGFFCSEWTAREDG